MVTNKDLLMTKDKLKEIFRKYYEYWDTYWPEVSAAQLPAYLRGEPMGDLLPSQRAGHYKFICLHGQLLADTDVEKAMRWLGFMQGVLWHAEIFSLEEIMDQSRGAVNDTTGANITEDSKPKEPNAG
jgi:hypothetical protein